MNFVRPTPFSLLACAVSGALAGCPTLVFQKLTGFNYITFRPQTLLQGHGEKML